MSPPTLIHGHAKPQPPERVVLLGGHGFLGRALMRHLARNNIEAVSPNSRDMDLTQPNAHRALANYFHPGDALVMLAAVNQGWRHDEEAFSANVGMASAVCRAMRDAECAQVVYISSDAV